MLVTGFCLVFWGFWFLGVYLLGFVWCVSLVFVFVGLTGFLWVLWLFCSRGGTQLGIVNWYSFLVWCGHLWFLVLALFVWVGCCRGW